MEVQAASAQTKSESTLDNGKWFPGSRVACILKRTMDGAAISICPEKVLWRYDSAGALQYVAFSLFCNSYFC